MGSSSKDAAAVASTAMLRRAVDVGWKASMGDATDGGWKVYPEAIRDAAAGAVSMGFPVVERNDADAASMESLTVAAEAAFAPGFAAVVAVAVCHHHCVFLDSVKSRIMVWILIASLMHFAYYL